MHDFQGLSTLEAVAAGCVPLVPDRLCYPEWFGAEFRYASHVDDVAREADAVADTLVELADRKRQGTLPAPPPVTDLGWTRMLPSYASLLADAAGCP